jgi:hypothetical protein
VSDWLEQAVKARPAPSKATTIRVRNFLSSIKIPFVSRLLLWEVAAKELESFSCVLQTRALPYKLGCHGPEDGT